MFTSDLEKKLGFKTVQGRYTDKALMGGYTSDLLSDVMGNAASGDVLVTIQAHKNTVAVATLVGIAAIVICNDRPIPDDMVEAAAAEDVAIFVTSKSQFEVSGLLWPELGGGAITNRAVGASGPR
jgi:hypothetical protein